MECLGMQDSTSCLLYEYRVTVAGIAQPCGSCDEPSDGLLLGCGRVFQK